MLGWGHSKRRPHHIPDEPEPSSDGETVVGSPSVQRLLILLREVSAIDEVAAGH